MTIQQELEDMRHNIRVLQKGTTIAALKNAIKHTILLLNEYLALWLSFATRTPEMVEEPHKFLLKLFPTLHDPFHIDEREIFIPDQQCYDKGGAYSMKESVEQNSISFIPGIDLRGFIWTITERTYPKVIGSEPRGDCPLIGQTWLSATTARIVIQPAMLNANFDGEGPFNYHLLLICNEILRKIDFKGLTTGEEAESRVFNMVEYVGERESLAETFVVANHPILKTIREYRDVVYVNSEVVKTYGMPNVAPNAHNIGFERKKVWYGEKLEKSQQGQERETNA